MTSRMVRKQLYLEPEQDRTLKALAAQLGASEAEVVRRAIDEMAERVASPREVLRARLRAAGLLADPAQPVPRLTSQDREESERFLDEWGRTHEPIGIDEALEWARGAW
ncbi:MAG TPA: ribbon-helix-helix protein, CopG family [Tepidiformaceae bacterium]|nr:ribbon-helix-helix protein, CopG family [Tepidiformaceae bacterium]